MNRTLKIFIACALGALIGSLVALQLNHYLWWIGLFAGGLTGYLSYQFHEVVSAVRIAWHKTFTALSNAAAWKQWALCTAALSFLFISIVIVFCGSVYLIGLPLHPNEPSQIVVSQPNTVWLSVFWVAFGEFVFLAVVSTALASGIDPQVLRFVVRKLNPFAICVYWPVFGVVLVMRRAIKGTPLAVQVLVEKILDIPFIIVIFAQGVWRFFRNICLFLWRVFIQIHSEERLLCLVAATMGSGVGYICGNALIGALAGGLLGVLQYEIVSKRILHLPVGKASIS